MAQPLATAIISHWHTLIENLQASPLEFYGAVEHAIERHHVTDSDRSRVDWSEGRNPVPEPGSKFVLEMPKIRKARKGKNGR